MATFPVELATVAVRRPSTTVARIHSAVAAEGRTAVARSDLPAPFPSKRAGS